MRAFKTKGKFNRKKKFSTKKALKEFKFIEFNTQTANFLIVDIDHRDISVAEIFEMLKERNILPTYIVYTDRGYQIGWALEHPFVTNPKFQSPLDVKLEKYARFILKKLTYLLKGDSAAIRIKGVWRNPVAHKSKFYYSKKYILNELDIYIKEIDDGIKIKEDGVKFHVNDKSIKGKVAKVLIDRSAIKEVIPGERNSVLWYLGMFMAKEIIRNKELSQNEKNKALNKHVKKEIANLNSMLRSPLSRKEVSRIFKSVKNYFSDNRILVSFGRYNDWPPQIKNKYIQLYRKRKRITKFSKSEIKKNNLAKVAFALAESASISEAIAKSTLSKTTFYKYYALLKQKSKLFFLFKLLVCLQKANSNLQQSVKNYIVVFFQTFYKDIEYVFNAIERNFSLFAMQKITERRLFFKDSMLKIC